MWTNLRYIVILHSWWCYFGLFTQQLKISEFAALEAITPFSQWVCFVSLLSYLLLNRWWPPRWPCIPTVAIDCAPTVWGWPTSWRNIENPCNATALLRLEEHRCRVKVVEDFAWNKTLVRPLLTRVKESRHPSKRGWSLKHERSLITVWDGALGSRLIGGSIAQRIRDGRTEAQCPAAGSTSVLHELSMASQGELPL